MTGKTDNRKYKRWELKQFLRVFDQETDIRGLRLNLMLGMNRDMKRVDLGITSGTTDDHSVGCRFLNIAKKAKGHGVLPIVNWAF